MMDKVDFKKTMPSYRAQSGRFDTIRVPEQNYLMIDGAGDPNTSAQFADAISTLYPIAYKLKFTSKRELGKDYVVPPLEGLWWADDMDMFTVARDKSAWSWTLLLMVPDWIGVETINDAIKQVAESKAPPAIAKIYQDRLHEGLCVQTLHIGSFDAEAETLKDLHHTFLPMNGLVPTQKHHEIYLSDFRKVAPERQRTILRQPVVPISS